MAETTDTRTDQKTNTDWIGYIWQKDKSKTNKTKAKQNKNKQIKIKFDISQSVTGQAFLFYTLTPAA